MIQDLRDLGAVDLPVSEEDSRGDNRRKHPSELSIASHRFSKEGSHERRQFIDLTRTPMSPTVLRRSCQ